MDSAWSAAGDTTVQAGTVPWMNLLLGVGIGLVATLITLVLAARQDRDRNGGGKPYDLRAGKGLPAAATWKFSDSWASNLTAVTAAAAAVFTGISDKVSGAFSPASLASFTVSTAVFLVVAALAPLTYAAFQERANDTATTADGNPAPAGLASALTDDDKPTLRGTRRGLYLATTLTSLAVMGALASVGVLVWRAGAWPGWARYVLVPAALVAAACLIGKYVVTSVRWLLMDAATASKKGKTAEVSESVAGLVQDDRGQRTWSVF